MDATAEKSRLIPGEVLAAERERQGLGPADIAQRLHMSVAQIEALERGDYGKLPRGPFLRGFVRNYAKVVGVPADSLLASLADAAPRDPAPGIVVPSQNIRFDSLSERMANPYLKAGGLAALVIAVGFGAMYWWLFVRTAPPAAPPRKAPETVAAVPVAPPASQPAPAPPVVAPQPEPAKPVASMPTPELPNAAAPKAAASQAVAQNGAPAAALTPPNTSAPVATGAEGATLKFRFKGRSWVEIRDARGKVLLTGLNDAGSEALVSGKPPFKVVVGNASDVQMFYNDREYGLEPYMREAVARLTVE